MNTKVIVVAHKEYPTIYQDDTYIPVEVGAAGRDKHFCSRIDCTGENISDKNYCYCELTGLYWAWKNLNYDILGLCHYRRYFSRALFGFSDSLKNILRKEDIESDLRSNDIILPRITKLEETVYQHSVHYYDDHHMDITRDVIKEKYPDYLDSFDEVMNSKRAHFFNMFIASKEIADGYMKWMFDVLEEVEKRYVFDCPDPRSVRVFGYISESLIDVYVLRNKLKVKERNLIYLERDSFVKRVMGKIKGLIK